MKKFLNLTVTVFTLLFSTSVLFAETFNNNLTAEDKLKLDSGEVLIKSIGSTKNISLNSEASTNAQAVITEFKKLSPKYLAEIIQVRPYEGNEDLPQMLEEILNNVGDYAGIPYYSERHQRYFNLYDSAQIKSKNTKDNKTEILADLQMQPFGTVNEQIEITNAENEILYTATNTNKLSYQGKIDCIYSQKMKISILLFKDGENWVLYGIGGVNAPRIPFFTERIETSFINRIKTFCNFIFSKI